MEGVTICVATPRALYNLKKDTVRPLDRQDAEALKRRLGLEVGARTEVSVGARDGARAVADAPRRHLSPLCSTLRSVSAPCPAPAVSTGVYRFRSLKEAQAARERISLGLVDT